MYTSENPHLHMYVCVCVHISSGRLSIWQIAAMII